MKEFLARTSICDFFLWTDDFDTFWVGLAFRLVSVPHCFLLLLLITTTTSVVPFGRHVPALKLLKLIRTRLPLLLLRRLMLLLRLLLLLMMKGAIRLL